MQPARIVVFVAIIVNAAARVSAEPITVKFNISMLQQCTDLLPCKPLDTTFRLAVAFDARAIFSETTDTNINERYGAPTFSTIPLDRPGVPRSGIEANRHSSQHVQFDGRLHTGVFEEVIVRRTESQVEVWRTTLFSGTAHSQRLPTTPNAETLLTLFRTEGANFDYIYSTGSTIDLFPTSQVFYFGRAVVADDSAPIPEPTSLVLLAITGVSSAICRRRQHGHRV
jgi:hypothetical protein